MKSIDAGKRLEHRHAQPIMGEEAPISGIKAGTALGAVSGLFHLFWMVLVATKKAQPLADFMFRLHSIEPVYKVLPFRVEKAALLVALSSAGGYAMGYLFAGIWNAWTILSKKRF